MARSKVLEYSAEKVVIEYEVARCIHAAECVHGLPSVFDPERRPWVDAGGASIDEIAEVVGRCPTGALRIRRSDGGAAEAIPAENCLTVAADGPVYVSGDLHLEVGAVSQAETRAALCRCGRSAAKPYCDNSHVDAGFRDEARLGASALAPGDAPAGAARLEIASVPDGPLIVTGAFTLRGAAGKACHGEKVAICRCGASSNKPYCDGSHLASGFEAE